MAAPSAPDIDNAVSKVPNRSHGHDFPGSASPVGARPSKKLTNAQAKDTGDQTTSRTPVQRADPPPVPSGRIRPREPRRGKIIGRTTQASTTDWAGDDDQRFLQDLWGFLDRDQLGTNYPAVVNAIDFLFRLDGQKPGDEASFRADLQTFCQPGQPHSLDEKAMATATKWLSSSEDFQTDGWLFVNPYMGAVKWRVYVNVVPAHAVKVFTEVCKTVIKIGAQCKLGSYPIVATGRDPIVCYLKTPGQVNLISNSLLSQWRANPQYFGNCSVRFTKRFNQASGISVVAEPPVFDVLTDLVMQWSTTSNGKVFLGGTSAQFNSNRVNMSFSHVIVHLLASAWLKASSQEQFLLLAATAIFTDLGLDPMTGLINPTAALIDWLASYLYGWDE